MILIILLYALLALTFPLAQLVITYANPLFAITFRMFIAGALLLGYCFIARQSIVIKRSDIWLFVQAAFFHIYLAFVPEYWSLLYLSALKVNLIYCLTPFISALFEYVIYKQYLSRQKIVGICVAFIGMMPLFLSASKSAPLAQTATYFFLPELALIVAVISATYAWFIIKKLNASGYSLPFINGTAMIGGALMTLIHLLIVQPPQPLVTSMAPFLYTIALLILISNIFGYNLYGWLLKKYSVTLLTLAGFMSPIFGAFYEWLFFRTYVTWPYVIAFIFIFAGLYIFSKEEATQK